MRRSLTLVVVLVLLAGCAGDADDQTTTTQAGSPGTTAVPSPTTTIAAGATTTDSGAADVTIVISGFSFGPQRTVSVGDVIEVRNDDTFPHTWTSADGLWDSGTLSGDAVFRHTFDEPGEYEFFCTIHPGDMRGSIIVEG